MLWTRWVGEPVHAYVWGIYLATRVWETHDAHSGYELPLPLRWPFSCARRHDFHHSHNTGNFGGFTLFWDIVLGTDAWGQQQQRKKQLTAVSTKGCTKPAAASAQVRTAEKIE